MSTAPTPLPHRQVPHVRTAILLGLLVGVVAIAVGILLLVRDTGGGTSSSGVVRGSGAAATDTRAVPAFGAVDLTGANAVVVSVGVDRSVTVHGDGNLLPYVSTEVRAGTLEIGQTREFSTSAPMSVEVGVPSLDAVTLSGSGTLTVSGVRADRFTVRVTGSGVVTVTGAATTLEATLSGTGDVRLGDLVAQDVTATVSGSGRMEVNATRSLDATVAGVGSIVYGGHPAQVKTTVTGTGSIGEAPG
jgi:hypothetical protein